MSKKGRVFSGARPTGRQHLGNYLGAIKNYVAMQDDYDCVYCIVDLHALTTVEDTLNLRQNTYEMALDWLAAGIRPDEAIMFVQSQVPQVTELHTILSMVTPLGKLTDLPTFKEKVRHQPDNVNYGLVGYPVLMTADIVLYKSNLVPVGVDQAPHIEFAREIVRSFNHRFHTQALIEPQMKNTEFPKILGIDGKEKMGKSLNNHIELASTPEETTKRVMKMVTDPARVHRYDPGNPDVCNVFSLHKIFSSPEEVAMIDRGCRDGSWGCVECKALLAKNLNKHLESFRAKRAEIAEKPDQVWDILHDGAKRARAIAEETMREVREAVQLPV
ncbi:MAG: tryptophan--tRNA ligase [Anaerolineae bacterium CFX3]|jgi:tryptophanyl-tRNA synthetase|nr:Tryptophan--tRNA ligase [Anaerolineales bacterium]MCC7512628.1 tryptophan--tRNA ligase [Anaerolineae bacterium]MCE7906675.1 tryptophan--tRNA ligase [Anaerolineae bacterium CFX3]OQY84055.1 MAG: tryptophan--tRNA ligase [Anaerolineae bacterium UTCFX3]MBW7920295.1 tryptophan--tRNA ligase [Anaerolineales bacterium]